MPHTAFIPPLVWIAPFAILLLGIAVFPLLFPHQWESNRNKLIVSAALGVPVIGLYLTQHPASLVHAATDYVSFMVLLGSLFVISGGVLMDGDLEATPKNNALFLGLGALLASFVGTTGASVLLIRPLLRANQSRRDKVHVASHLQTSAGGPTPKPN